MWFMNYIVQRLNDASGYFYDVYLEIYGWTWPLYLASYPFLWLSSTFSSLAWNFYDFSEWINWVITELDSFLDQHEISQFLSYTIWAAANAWNWVANSFSNVWNIVDEWWRAFAPEIHAIIHTLTDPLQAAIDTINTWLASVQEMIDNLALSIPDVSELLSWFTNWWGNILTNLAAWWSDRLLEVQSLIDSAFTLREPFWAGWQDWRDKVIEFFTDPEEWLYKSIDRIFERFW